MSKMEYSAGCWSSVPTCKHVSVFVVIACVSIRGKKLVNKKSNIDRFEKQQYEFMALNIYFFYLQAKFFKCDSKLTTDCIKALCKLKSNRRKKSKRRRNKGNFQE